MKKITIFFLGMLTSAVVFVVFSFKTPKEQSLINEHLTMAVLYQQQSAEAKALTFQAFNYAKISLDEKLKNKKLKKTKKAVIVDIDETVLDNSPFEARCIIEGTGYPKYWNEWLNLGQAKAITGSVEFLKYAVSKGVEVFYVSNRKNDFRDITIKNLKDQGFPYADTIHLVLRSNDNSKEERRKKIAETHEILLLLGDNLADFSVLYDNADADNRKLTVENQKEEFGKNYIILPNAMYGDWESALYGYNFKLSEDEKFQIRRKNLIGFD